MARVLMASVLMASVLWSAVIRLPGLVASGRDDMSVQGAE